MKEIKDSKIRIKKKDSSDKKRDFDTLSITRELEKSLSIGEQIDKEKERLKEEKKKRTIRNIGIAIIILIIISVTAFAIWLRDTYKTNEYSSHSMISTSLVDVKTQDDGSISFLPRKNNKEIGLIIYPGEKIIPRSYATLAQDISKKGFNVYVAKLKFNFPAFSSNVADSIIGENSNIKKWYLIAHSESGELALKEAANHQKIDGVVFLGSYPSGDDLKLINKPVLSIWGTKDGILDFTKFYEYKKNMPPTASFYEIVGGNNTGFADINMLDGDNKALISQGEQKNISSEQIVNFVEKNANNN
ncbi:alpha/beta hydrolase [Peptostreptococcus faecalis]|uniref:alpha/beta hydrolase n=1 Tax=Peptostreptococcus faecalis TaxID=2045015 RepID=UPI000C7B55E3|nr:alpha/beta hydrolase [Peptostreptococcus faecalis]